MKVSVARKEDKSALQIKKAEEEKEKEMVSSRNKFRR